MQPEVVKVKEIKPALYGFVREALKLLSSGGIPDDKAIHDVRVLMKKSRASVTLLKSQIDTEVFNREYPAFRETGRIMRSWRENTVHKKILRNLKKKYPRALSTLDELPAVRRLMETAEMTTENQDQMMLDIEKVKDLLNKS